jgi:hypothetical protein
MRDLRKMEFRLTLSSRPMGRLRNNFIDAVFKKGGISLNSKLTTDGPVLEIRHPGLAENLIAKS